MIPPCVYMLLVIFTYSKFENFYGGVPNSLSLNFTLKLGIYSVKLKHIQCCILNFTLLQ
jgi:hypothetical protein